jgi:hypothetical protein
MYLAFLLNVFYMLCILIFIYIIGQYFFIWCFMKYVYGAIGVERVRIVCVANLCVTHSRMIHLTWTCEIHGFWIVQHILDNLRMVTVAFDLVSVLCVFHSWLRQRNPIILWHIDIGRVNREQRGYAAKITNGRYTRQILDNTWRSLFLGGFRTYPS